MNYEVCQVPNYKVNYENSLKSTKPIDSITSLLNNDLQLHERLGKNDNLKLSIDVDKLMQNPVATLEQVIYDICDYVQISIEEISYTTNFSITTGSHHIVIPKYYMKSSDQKVFWKKFREKYGYGKEIDADVFGKDGWLRLPNQTKERIVGTEHIIQKGENKDFVLKYIEESTLFNFVKQKSLVKPKEAMLKPKEAMLKPKEAMLKPKEAMLKPKEAMLKPKIIKKNVELIIEETTDEDIAEGTNEEFSDCSSLASEPHENTKKSKTEHEDKYIELLFDVIKNDVKVINWDLWFQIAGVLKSNNYDKKIFIKYSKVNDIQNKASETWDGIQKTTMSIFTLQSIAKQVNFTGYKEWLHKYEVNLYSPLFTSGLIADYFKLLYNDKFLAVDDKVYMFNGVYWETLDKKNTELTNFIDKIFIKNLLEYASEQLSKFTSQLTGDKDLDIIIEATIKKITELLYNINKLRSVSSRKPIIEDIISFITNNNIEFNANPYLFAFKNCVFDLKLNKFVTPEPNFYITKTSGYSYDNTYSTNYNKTLEDLVDTIFPDPEVKEYYLSILSTGLCGLQIENCFIATGTGGNGKSLINSLMMKTAGEYAYKLPSDVLLSAIKVGPNPEVANMNNIRFILTQEPNNKKKICCSTLKEITGDKTLNVRELYSSKCSIKLTNTTLIEANEIPAVDEVNDAVSRRIRTIPFLSRYVEQSVYDSLEDKTNVFVANSYYKTDEFQDNYKQALFNLLIVRFKKFIDNKHSLPTQPKSCLEKCSAFLGTCDDIYSWFESYYEKTETIESSEAISLADIYSSFSGSDFFNNLSKVDKRKYNKKYFLSKIEENIFLRKYIKLRDTSHNSKKMKSDYIVGWKIIVEELNL